MPYHLEHIGGGCCLDGQLALALSIVQDNLTRVSPVLWNVGVIIHQTARRVSDDQQVLGAGGLSPL